MHHPFAMHVLQSRAELDEVFPYCPLWDQTFLLLEMLDHSGEIAGVGQLEDDVELVLLDEGGEVLDHVGVVKLLQQLDLLHAVQARLI